MPEQHVDVLIVGAGLAGIGTACRLRQSHPRRSLAVLESRERLGGTWDLFRYPGVRSDSDMFTLSYPFRPWRRPESMADGDAIREYVADTAREHGIDELISYGRRVISASWSSQQQRWTVQVARGTDTAGADTETWTCCWLALCTGYYDYSTGHTPDIPGLDSFDGDVVHPQFWPADLDVTGRRVVVIGSGATAVSLLPALAQQAEHVTMLQRSPTWMGSMASRDPRADALRRRLPAQLAHRLVRARNILVSALVYQLCQRFPERAGRVLLAGVAKQLPDPTAVATDFTPSYNPWDQRLCAIRDGDFFRALRTGRASVVTDTIEAVTPTGVSLTSGRAVEADVLVTATGLELQALGGATLEIDGAPVAVAEKLLHRGCMLDGVPNLSLCVGYTNSSWTLRADLTARHLTRVLARMDARRAAVAVPRPRRPVQRRPLLPLSSGYVRRGEGRMPQQGGRHPWRMPQNYLRDVVEMRLGGPARELDLIPARTTTRAEVSAARV